MSDQKTYSQKEISKILSKASEIQTQKDLYGDKEGLTEAELIQVAQEVGIDPDSLQLALELGDLSENDNSYSWISASPNFQKTTLVDGEVSDENWEAIIQEIRRVTGGIGTVNKVGKTFEWEQRRKDIGYKHISFSPQNGKTRIQYVNSWKGIRFIFTFFAGLIGFMGTAVALDGSSFSEFISIALATGGAFAGLGLSRILLKPYHARQVQESEQLLNQLTKTLSRRTPEIIIDDETPESTPTTRSQTDRMKN
jgi:hypothetical protein